MVNKKNKRSIFTILILAVVLLVPGFLYVLVNKVGSNSYVVLPVYGEKTLSGKMNRKMGREIPDTIFHKIDSIAVIDGDDNAYLAFSNDSSIRVVHFFYGRDDGLSKSLLRKVTSVVDRFNYSDKIKFYSISLDTAESKDNLKSTVQEFNPNHYANWFIVKSKDIDILPYVRENFLVDAIRNPQDTSGFIFSNNYILIDSQNRIRGYYDINLKTDLDRLEDEIKVQVVEELRNHPPKIVKK